MSFARGMFTMIGRASRQRRDRKLKRKAEAIACVAQLVEHPAEGGKVILSKTGSLA